ncbi:hypothetical protein [Paenibacillus hunanensis]|uniref:Zinc finger CHC2-type domain-containing protein n=1 Tax=Paenibacillus hunanensis TaxID=539262 RepID=A0ABU1IWV3_9BACL|nr:hypothetical protein [Paenibacillus hunanensis]MDR6243485.1 hypothetical protein [Paenibacillus hunanensis]GGI98098.1 hypothetical protein GCM10008022_03470 [Paenibacillus hunanensis]
MLPSIVEIAEQHGLIMDSSSRNREEVKCKCPFCHEDSKPNKERRYYLSLNSKDQVFKCWFCGERGGVFRFISLLDQLPEAEVVQYYRKRKTVHPVERLTSHQRHLLRQWLGGKEPDWLKMRVRDAAYYKRSLDLLWEDWQEFVACEQQHAYFELILGIQCQKYPVYVERIQKREKQIDVNLLQYVCETYSMAQRPEWTCAIEQRVEQMLIEIQISEMANSRTNGG